MLLLLAASALVSFIFLRLPSTAFMPHGMCYLWNGSLLWSNVGADAVIGTSYVVIAAGLGVFLLRHRRRVPFHWVFGAFAMCILACAASHGMEVVTLWKPIYWLSTEVKLITAAASALTAVALPLVLPRVGKTIREACNAERYRVEALRSNVELARRTIERSEELTRTNAALEIRIAERTIEVDSLNAALAHRLHELEKANAALERDAAERKRIAIRLDHLAHHDPVTALPNRVRLMERLAQAMAKAQRAGTGVLVVYLDLDRFKAINDTLGHAAGDRVLAEIASRISRCMRTGDTASRVGGDEFVIVCATADRIADAPQIANRLLIAIAEPIALNGRTLALGASIGISVFPGDSANPEQLIHNADLAMYRAKENGRNGFVIYAADVDAAPAGTSHFNGAAASGN